jgi:hypothetical protein
MKLPFDTARATAEEQRDALEIIVRAVGVGEKARGQEEQEKCHQPQLPPSQNLLLASVVTS